MGCQYQILLIFYCWFSNYAQIQTFVNFQTMQKDDTNRLILFFIYIFSLKSFALGTGGFEYDN